MQVGCRGELVHSLPADARPAQGGRHLRADFVFTWCSLCNRGMGRALGQRYLRCPTLWRRPSAQHSRPTTGARGRVVYVSGTAFPGVQRRDGTQFTPGQCNNCLIFPGQGVLWP